MSKRPFTSVSEGRQKFVRRSAGSRFFAIANGEILGRNLVDDWFRQLARDRYNAMVEWIRQLLRDHAPFDVTRRLQYVRQSIRGQWSWLFGYEYSQNDWRIGGGFFHRFVNLHPQTELFHGIVLWVNRSYMHINRRPRIRAINTEDPTPDEFAWWNSFRR